MRIPPIRVRHVHVDGGKHGLTWLVANRILDRRAIIAFVGNPMSPSTPCAATDQR